MRVGATEEEGFLCMDLYQGWCLPVEDEQADDGQFRNERQRTCPFTDLQRMDRHIWRGCVKTPLTIAIQLLNY